MLYKSIGAHARKNTHSKTLLKMRLNTGQRRSGGPSARTERCFCLVRLRNARCKPSSEMGLGTAQRRWVRALPGARTERWPLPRARKKRTQQPFFGGGSGHCPAEMGPGTARRRWVWALPRPGDYLPRILLTSVDSTTFTGPWVSAREYALAASSMYTARV